MLSEIVRFTKAGGPLTKRISLAEDGALTSDGSACLMSRGQAERVEITGIAQFGALVGGLAPNQAIALGALRAGLPDKVSISTKKAMNGHARPDVVARTAANIGYRPGPGFALIDYDSKGMPADVAERLDREGGCWSALVSVMPELGNVARVTRISTSAGLYRMDNGARIAGSKGVHIYVAVKASSDIERFIKTLHDKCWLAGFGWMMVGAGGQLLERSIVDRMVAAPERLVFEGAPVLDPPLAQDQAARQPDVTEGEALDTIAACPPLSALEKARLKEMRAKAAHWLAGDSAKARDEFIERQASKLVERGIPRRAALEAVRKQCDGILLPTIELPFDDPELAGKTVADVLVDPAAFEGETLADPLEGVEYGRTKAKIMRRADGTVWINSFAHGRTVYDIKLDAAAIRTAMAAADAGDVVGVFVELALRAAIEPADEEALITYAKERTGTGMRAIQRQLKQARGSKAEIEAEADRKRRLAERTDPRPMLPAPAPDAEWLPEMTAYAGVLGKSKERIPPARNMDGDLDCVTRRKIPGTHAFATANEDGDITGEAPAQWVISVLSEAAAAEMLERHIEFGGKDGRPVHLGSPFVNHFMNRDDALPPLVAISTLPIVLADGHMLAPDGLDRERGIAFNIDPALMKILPKRKTCDRAAVGEAMIFLTDEWLVDVATDYAGKCSLIAMALTMIERSLIEERPVWFVTAGRRASGKTTALKMLIEGVTGIPAAAAAWSPNEEERRKSLMSYLMAGVSYILWDNIARGSQISCPHIEKACTSAVYADRKLGVSEMVATAAATVQSFTGNNIGPKGDLASRSLQVRIDVDRIDPENREFRHPHPVEWTRSHRSEILRALYVILLGNPALDLPRQAPMKTRFKLWHRLVGSAVEHAAQCAGQNLDFGSLFLDQEADDEDATSLAECLASLDAAMAERDALAGRPKQPFKASSVADMLNSGLTDPDQITVRGFLFPTQPANTPVTAKAVGKRLKAHIGEPVPHGRQTLTLKSFTDAHDKTSIFFVATF